MNFEQLTQSQIISFDNSIPPVQELMLVSCTCLHHTSDTHTLKGNTQDVVS